MISPSGIFATASVTLLSKRLSKADDCSFYLAETWQKEYNIPMNQLIGALRVTARRLQKDDTEYYWSHMGTCNCGHLAQTVTSMGGAAIHSFALEKPGDWAEHIQDYCPSSGYHIDDIIETMVKLGLRLDEIEDLERLQNSKVLEYLKRYDLDYRKKEDLVLYLNGWADMLEEKQLASQRVAMNPAAESSL